MKLIRLAVLCSLAASSAFAAPAAHWEYEGEHGPKQWGKLDKDYATCGLGKHQSPVDIRKAETRADLSDLTFNYVSAPFKLINNGHTVQVNNSEGGTLSIGGHSYKLAQFHFHTPSEERINGKPYDMVAHLVHKDDAGKLAVVAVLIKRGKENAALKPVFDNMPISAGPQHTVEGVNINFADLLPSKRGYYHFEGSLTTPPCSEGVAWYVLNTPVEASSAQIKQLRALYPHNARPVQPLNDRVVVQHGI